MTTRGRSAILAPYLLGRRRRLRRKHGVEPRGEFPRAVDATASAATRRWPRLARAGARSPLADPLGAEDPPPGGKPLERGAWRLLLRRRPTLEPVRHAADQPGAAQLRAQERYRGARRFLAN